MAGIPIPPGGGTPLPPRPNIPPRPTTANSPKITTVPRPAPPSTQPSTQPNQPGTNGSQSPTGNGSGSSQLKDLQRERNNSPSPEKKEKEKNNSQDPSSNKKTGDTSPNSEKKSAQPEPLKNKYSSEAQAAKNVDGKKVEKGGGTAGKAGADGAGKLGQISNVAKKAANYSYFGSMAINKARDVRNRSKIKKDIKFNPPEMQIGPDGKTKSTDPRINDKGKVKSARELKIDSAKARAANKNARLEEKGKTEKTRKKYVDKYGQEQGEKATVGDRFKNGVKNLGWGRCLVCGYQNGLNNEQLCKRCAKKGLDPRSAKAKAERVANKATDVSAMVAAQALEKFTLGIANAQLTQGYIGKILAATNKVVRKPTKWVVVALVSLILLPLGLGLLGVVISLAGGDLGNQQSNFALAPNVQESIEEGDIQERAVEPIGSEQILNSYKNAAGQEGIPWSIVAGITGVATEHGRISPYTGEDIQNRYPNLETPIVGGGSGPFLLSGLELRSKEQVENKENLEPSEIDNYIADDPNTQNFDQAARQTAILLADARDKVYEEKGKDLESKGYTYDDLMSNPFSEGGVEFWSEVIRYLPMDYASIPVEAPAGTPTQTDPGSFADDGSPTVMGAPMISKEDMKQWFASNPGSNQYSLSIPKEALIDMYYEEGLREGVRPDWAFVQGIVESAWYSTGNARNHNNFSGYGHCNTCPRGWIFDGIRDGVRAQIQLLKRAAVGNEAPLATDEVLGVMLSGARGRPIWGGYALTHWGILGGVIDGKSGWATDPNYWCINSSIMRNAGAWWPVKSADEKCGRKASDYPAPTGTVVGVSVGDTGTQNVVATFASGNVPDPSNMGLNFRPERGKVNNNGFLQANTVAARDFIEKVWPDAPIISDWRPIDPGGFAWHNRGLALDIGCKTRPCTQEETNLLHTIASWFASNPQVFDNDYMIWQNRINSGQGWTIDNDPPTGSITADHFDHIHLNFASGSTLKSPGPLGNPWVGSSLEEVSNGQASNPTPGSGGGSPAAEIPKDKLVALASISRAADYSGTFVEIPELVGGGDDDKDENNFPNLPGIDGNPSAQGFIWPVEPHAQLTSPFGFRWGAMHEGIDVAAGCGSGIYASKEGTVNHSGWMGGYGMTVQIDHGNGLTSRYAHNSELLVSVGQKVQRGQQIAKEGTTGDSTGCHLHFEIRINGSAKDPINSGFLPGR